MKHRRAKPGDRATFDGRELEVAAIDGDALTLVNADRSEFIGVHRKDRRLRVEVTE